MPVIEIDSPTDPRLADYRNLKDARLRRRCGLFVVEGRANLRCLIERSRHRPRSLLLNASSLAALRDLIERLDEAVPVYLGSQSLLDSVVGYPIHRGCLALGHRPPETAARGLIERLAVDRGPSLVLVLEGLTDHENVGAIFRSAMAFGADAVLLCPRCCDPLYRRAIRVSMGAALVVPYARAEQWPGALRALARGGYTVAALDPSSETAESLTRAEPAAAATPLERVALLAGSEGAGLSAAALAAADRRLRIEMMPGFDSINVATACAIALHHFFRPRGAAAASAPSTRAEDRSRRPRLELDPVAAERS